MVRAKLTWTNNHKINANILAITAFT